MQHYAMLYDGKLLTVWACSQDEALAHYGLTREQVDWIRPMLQLPQSLN